MEKHVQVINLPRWSANRLGSRLMGLYVRSCVVYFGSPVLFCTGGSHMKFKIKNHNSSQILLVIGIALLVCYFGGLFYIYNIQEYSPYASAGADLDALIHSALF